MYPEKGGMLLLSGVWVDYSRDSGGHWAECFQDHPRPKETNLFFGFEIGAHFELHDAMAKNAVSYLSCIYSQIFQALVTRMWVGWLNKQVSL